MKKPFRLVSQLLLAIVLGFTGTTSLAGDQPNSKHQLVDTVSTKKINEDKFAESLTLIITGNYREAMSRLRDYAKPLEESPTKNFEQERKVIQEAGLAKAIGVHRSGLRFWKFPKKSLYQCRRVFAAFAPWKFGRSSAKIWRTL